MSTLSPRPPGPSARALSRPTERELLDGLSRWLGPDDAEALWNHVCAYHGLQRPVIDVRGLAAGARAVLDDTEGRAKITARCFLIKTSNFLALTKGLA